MLFVLAIAKETHSVSIAVGEAKPLAKEPLRVFDQLVCPGGLQAEFGQFAGLDGPFEVGLHISNSCLEVSDSSGRIAMSFELSEVTPMSSFGGFAI